MSNPLSPSATSPPSSPSVLDAPLQQLNYISRFSLSAPTSQERLSLSPIPRIFLGTGAGLFTGVILGGAHGAQMSSLRFRAENTHRLPTSTKGWYLYHKTKNYHMMYYGLQEGCRTGLRLATWTGAYFTVEAAVDRLRGERKDFMSSVVAGLSVAGAFSAVNRFPMVTAAKTARMGLVAGACYGLLQDGLALIKGRRLRYVDFILRRDRPDEVEQATAG